MISVKKNPKFNAILKIMICGWKYLKKDSKSNSTVNSKSHVTETCHDKWTNPRANSYVTSTNTPKDTNKRNTKIIKKFKNSDCVLLSMDTEKELIPSNTSEDLPDSITSDEKDQTKQKIIQFLKK